ncbi:hypothetical protein CAUPRSCDRAFT_12838 [Caulochytrium protostelioides]|uniref:CUE domain-containing protein n=1 Tax=Caulochytrium protostelioides TaxID=1555241 RepID=A0A4P9WQL0_9FUNG|nr:hypothetical protein CAUPRSCDRAFT_12838 [Caulochytrium protostelioides]
MASDTATLLVSVALLYFAARYVMGGRRAAPSSASAASAGAASAAGSRARGGRRVSPEHLAQIEAMFPGYDRAAIEADLLRSGSVEATCDNILAGKIPMVSRSWRFRIE